MMTMEVLLAIAGGGGGGVLGTWASMRQQRSVDLKTGADAQTDLSRAAMALALDLVRDLRQQIADLTGALRDERERCDAQLEGLNNKLSDYRHELRNQDAMIEALRHIAGVKPERFAEIVAELESKGNAIACATPSK